MKIENEYYQTSDLALTTALSLFHPIDSIDRKNPSKVIFYFKRESQIDKLIENYYSGILQVSPSAYFSQLKNIKTRIYGG